MLGDTAVAVHPQDKRYSDLVGKTLILPLVNREIPVIADDYSDPDKGSGAVKITPGHDFNDFEVGRRHNLEIINIFDENACIVDKKFAVNYIGLDRFEARKKVIEDLEKEPAYKRKGIEIKSSSEQVPSRLSLDNDSNDDLQIRSNNSFLHDNVD